MAKFIAAMAASLLVATVAGVAPAEARGGHHGLFGHAHHGHPINAWMGSRRLRLR